MATIADRIVLFNQNRDKERLLLKYAAMRTDAFRFFRGTCHLFYEDLFHSNPLPVSPATWICGDLHLENFGSFKGGDRLVYFDINDFDEGVLGPALWEMVRLLTSVAVAGQALRYSKQRITVLYTSLLNGYSAQLQQGKPMTVETATAKGEIEELLIKVGTRKEKKLVKERSDEERSYSRLITDNLKAFPVPANEKKKITLAIGNWLAEKKGKRKWKVHDTVYRIAGTGSIGIKRNVVLVQNNSTLKKYLLDLKQALPSSLIPFIHIPQPAWQNEAERVISIQNRMQHVCPGWLSATCIGDDWFILKEIQPTSDKINFAGFKTLQDGQTDMLYTLGQLTASAQLRSSGRQGSAIADDLINFGADQNWRSSLIDYASQYALQVKNDYREFCKAFDKGYFQ